MKSNFKILGSTAALAILVLSFQNCSPVNFGAGNEFAQKSGVPAGTIDDSLVDDIPNDDDDSDEVADHDPSDEDHADHDEKDCPNKGPGNADSGDKYRAMCKESNKKGFISLSADASITGSNGSLRFKAPSIKVVSGNNGSVVALHDGTGAGTIKELSGNNGHTVICGFDVENISGLNGGVVIVGGHVEKITGTNGAIKLVDSTLGSAAGNNGSIKVQVLK